ncbi:uncharacterized protein LOC126826673 isoform X1 [Patella vulgata]|uniref:uncharacterized protein LOC126826673 isoform X1 n=1 Tax=Patella vulgata TaxID=6465 RepID=UPI0021802947|nr:uncharacterized protein LOC126826673 isoform X1 [Patella vulgata]XP_050411619.1 uncharacterized protein LOC126826673 isoform X1 [Patella vulgata]XP_050411620.1 uncharacterized protein LOC126826673 isoform X1 [Patella vulgata]
MGNKESTDLPQPPLTEHVASNDPQLQMYNNFGFVEDGGKCDKHDRSVFVIDGYNNNDSIKKTKPDDFANQSIKDKHVPSGPDEAPPAPQPPGIIQVTADSETKAANILELIRRSFRRKRRLSLGDTPYGLTQAATESTEETDDQDKFLLGRAEARDASIQHLVRANNLRRSIRITQVAPSNSSIREDGEEKWKMPINDFSSKRQGPNYKQHSKRMRSYYKAQDELITSFEEIQLQIEDAMDNSEDVIRLRKQASCYAKMTFALNLLLLIAKTVASVMSGSIAIISSLVDSAVDLVSGIVLWWTNHAVKKRNIYAYPQGRTKLEPIAIVIISVVMALASLQLIRESIERIAALTGVTYDLPNMEIPTMIIAGSTVVIKFIMWLMCRRIQSPSVQALAQDHRNDVLSNTVAIICGYLGSMEMFEKTHITEFSFVDPGGAILISMYIVFNWWKTGKDQIKLLTGHSAQPDFLSKLTWISVNHHPRILNIDTVRAFHFGNNFLVEVDIVLPEQMKLKEAHDIGESLQQKLETLPDVERAFVHLDYEFNHSPSSEHKVV